MALRDAALVTCPQYPKIGESQLAQPHSPAQLSMHNARLFKLFLVIPLYFHVAHLL